MHYLLLIGAFLFFAFIAPLKTTVMLVGVALLVSLVVKVAAQVVANAPVTLGEAFRAVACSLVFAVLAMLALGGISAQAGVSQLTGAAGLAALGALFLAYGLGFKVGLGTTLPASGAIALVSTLVSAGLLWLAMKVL